MAVIEITDLSDDVRAALEARARRAGQSLPEFARSVLVTRANVPDPREFFDQLGEELSAAGTHFPLEDAVAHIRALRDEDEDL